MCISLVMKSGGLNPCFWGRYADRQLVISKNSTIES